MTTSNEQILDSYVRHQTYLIRYAGGLRNKVTPLLVKTEQDVFDAVAKWVSRAGENSTLTGNKGRAWQRDFEQEISDIRSKAWGEINNEVTEQLKDLSSSEAAFAANAVESSLPVVIGLQAPPIQKLVAIVNSQPFRGRTLKQWINRTADSDVQRILNRTKIGIAQGETPTQIAREIIGTRAAKYRDGEARKAFRDIESVILTLTNGIQNEAKQALYNENKDIIKKEQFVATLDSRTTLICASNDNKIFRLGEGPMPPLHFRCRSVRVPYINENDLGLRGFDSSTEKQLLREYSSANGIDRETKRSDLPRGHKTKFDDFARKRRRELVGQVPASVGYSDFLKRQTKEFQNDTLGPTRAALFRKGEITLDKFVAKDGRNLTLEELKEKGFDV